MRFLSIVSSAENQGPPPQPLMDAMGKLIETSLKDGSLVQTGGLAGSASAKRVRTAKGKLSVIDGPFAESKEVIGGYAIIEAPTWEAALENTRNFMELHRKHWPEWEGECEVREIAFLAP